MQSSNSWAKMLPAGSLRSVRRRRILESAQRTFLRDGYRQATMERVSEDAEVSKQTLYNYFEDKEELFVSLLELRLGEGLVTEIESALQMTADTDPATALQATTAALFRYASDPQIAAVHRVMIEVMSELPDVINHWRRRFFLRNVERLRAALDRAAASGQLRSVDSEATAYLLLGIGASYALFRTAQPDDQVKQLTPARMAGALADLLGHGLLVDGPQEA